MIDKEFVSIDPYKKDEMLFRYIDIQKLVLMVTENALPLSRITAFNDQFEGSYPPTWIEMERLVFRQFFGEMLPVKYREDPDGYLEESKKREYNWRRNNFASCWHANDDESEAMWKLYAGYDKGVAIQTDIASLVEGLPSRYDNKGHKTPIHIDAVKYIDFKHPDMSRWKFGLTPFYLLKRKPFEYEREVRVRTILTPGWGNKEQGVEPEVEGDYILLKTDLKRIVKRVILAPDCSGSYREHVSSVVKEHGFDFRVEDSALAAKPVFLFWADLGFLQGY